REAREYFNLESFIADSGLESLSNLQKQMEGGDITKFDAITLGCSTKNHSILEISLKRSDGSEFNGRLTITALQRGPNIAPEGYLFIINDVTEAKEKEEELRRKTQLLSQAQR